MPAQILILVAALGLGSEAWAAGKKRQPDSGPPAVTTPRPVRPVVLGAVGTRPFQLPNGARVDLAADLDSLLLTAVASTEAFSPADRSETFPCDTHLEVRAAVTTLDLNVAELGLRFGYSPAGETAAPVDLTGRLGVRIGTIAMDFSVWECAGGRCSAMAASSASHLTAGVELALEIDFGEVATGPSLVFNSPLGPILRRIMTKGMQELARSPRLGELSWSAVVREYFPEAGLLVFDAGARSRLAPNQAFVVYAVTESTGFCGVYRAVAYARTTQVDTISSTALVERVLDERGVHDGDRVMVRFVAP